MKYRSISLKIRYRLQSTATDCDKQSTDRIRLMMDKPFSKLSVPAAFNMGPVKIFTFDFRVPCKTVRYKYCYEILVTKSVVCSVHL